MADQPAEKKPDDAEKKPDETPAAPPKRRGFGSVALILVIALVVLGAAEGAMRAIAPAPIAAPLERQHPLYRRVYAPNAKIPRKDSRTGALVPIETNALGFRARAVKAIEKPQDAFRIVFLGGGPLEGAGLPEEVTAPARTETILDGRRKIDDDLRIESVNMAQEGLGLAEAIALFIHRALPLKPDLVVVLPGPEDLLVVGRPGFDPTRAADAFDPPPPPAFGEWLASRFRLASLVQRAAAGKPVVVDPRARRRAVPFTRCDLTLAAIPWLKRQLHLLSLLAKDAKVPIAFVTMPTLLRETGLAQDEDERCRLGYVDDQWNVDAGSMLAGVRAWNDETRSACAREGTQLVDLEPLVPKDLGHFDDEATLTSDGHQSVATELVRALFGAGTARRAP